MQLLLVVAMLACALPVQARDMTGKGGVGMLVTNDGMPMLAFRYWRTQVALEVLAGYVATTPSQPTAVRQDLTELVVAMGLLYRVADAPRASLSVGVRPWARYLLGQYTVPATTAGGSPTSIDTSTWRFGAEIPLQAEAFLTDHFGLVGSVGLTVDLGQPISVGASRATTLDTQANTSVLVGVRGGFSGGLGAMYYF